LGQGHYFWILPKTQKICFKILLIDFLIHSPKHLRPITKLTSDKQLLSCLVKKKSCSEKKKRETHKQKQEPTFRKMNCGMGWGVGEKEKTPSVPLFHFLVFVIFRKMNLFGSS